jgi:hypothetical protein
VRTVVIPLPGEDFSTALLAMRDRLQRNRCEPAGYRYDQDEDTVIVSVDFVVPRPGQGICEIFCQSIRRSARSDIRFTCSPMRPAWDHPTAISARITRTRAAIGVPGIIGALVSDFTRNARCLGA